MNQHRASQSQSDPNPNLKRRGFVTIALGAGVFVAASRSMAQTSGEKPGGVTVAKTPPHNKIFIVLPGDRYYAVPEEALAPFKVELEQFNAELAKKQAAEPKTPEAQDSAGPPTGSRRSKSAGIDQAAETGLTAEELKRKIQKKMEDPSPRQPSVTGVRG